MHKLFSQDKLPAFALIMEDKKFRSQNWFGFIYRAWMKNQGIPSHEFDGLIPEAALGGNFAVVQTGDTISIDVGNRKIHLHVSDEELTKRKSKWKSSVRISQRGYVHLYQTHVQQAHLGADMDFLVGGSGSEVSGDSH